VSTIIVTETMVLPTGMAPSHHSAHHFALFVRWSQRGWVVTTQFREERLSVKGRKWGWPPRRNLRHYWWPDRESALVAALVEVDLVKVNGRTFSEWETR
jgi:hypothetical protein